MTKGADAIIADLLSEESKESVEFKKTQQYVDEYAGGGLRTLFIAYKVLDEATYKDWNEKSVASKLLTKNREEEVAAVDGLIETELILIGSTAIEDKL